MVSCWKVLGLEPSSDLRVIKRAYSQRLKCIHPEDDPEGFMQLRQAYEQACNMAKASQSDRRNLTIGVTPNNKTQPVSRTQPVDSDARRLRQKVNSLARSLEQLLASENDINPVHLTALLSAPELSRVGVRVAIGNHLLPVLLDRLHNKDRAILEADILIQLDNCFGWTSDKEAGWQVDDRWMDRLCLLLDSARSEKSLDKERHSWSWFNGLLFSMKGRLNRIEYFFALASLLALGFISTKAISYIASSSVSYTVEEYINKLVFAVYALVTYGVLSTYIRRSRDASDDSKEWKLLRRFFPPALIIVPFLPTLKSIAGNDSDPRIRYENLYHTYMRSLFGVSAKTNPIDRLCCFFASVDKNILWLTGISSTSFLFYLVYLLTPWLSTG
jgi:uncharacterized membrane protein YhaH (DUF805 family)